MFSLVVVFLIPKLTASLGLSSLFVSYE